MYQYQGYGWGLYNKHLYILFLFLVNLEVHYFKRKKVRKGHTIAQSLESLLTFKNKKNAAMCLASVLFL